MGRKIAVIQPNIPQQLKKASLDGRAGGESGNYEKHVKLTSMRRADKPDLIVWPEAAIYRGVYVKQDAEPYFEETRWYKRLLRPAEETKIPDGDRTLIVDYGKGHPDQYSNSAVRVDPEKGVTGRYNKIPPGADRGAVLDLQAIVHAISGLKLESMTPGKEVPLWDAGVVEVRGADLLRSDFPGYFARDCKERGELHRQYKQRRLVQRQLRAGPDAGDGSVSLY
jgi:predicted amidohydrolase